MEDIKAKQQIVEKIKSSTNILITVSKDPSVDALSTAIGLTLLFDSMEKHATAVFSGATPPAIAFLEPEKVLDDTTDSLRDFIIALDKSKADHLRYKVEGDSVKIFITPYKTTISSEDLEFSQGDYNVELVIALGVDNQDHLDGALDAHGQILHDATVITVTAGDQTSSLGGIDWHDGNASSLAEMIAGLSEAMKEDKKKSLLTAEIATALLTGIVAETDRFSNKNTTAKAMTVSSQLVAAGADPQLIAVKLEEGGESLDGTSSASYSAPESKKESSKDDGSFSIQRDDTSDKKDDSKADSNDESPLLSIHSNPGETLEELDRRVKQAEQAASAKTAGDIVDNTVAASGSAYALPEVEHPMLGGTLSATTEQAAADAAKASEEDQNKTILSHSYLSSAPNYNNPMNANESTGSGGFVVGGDGIPGPMPGSQPVTDPSLPGPEDLGLPLPPPLPLPPLPPQPSGIYASAGNDSLVSPEAPQPERLGDILAPEAPAESSAYAAPVLETPPVFVPPVTPPADNPGQFKIPGQP